MAARSQRRLRSGGPAAAARALEPRPARSRAGAARRARRGACTVLIAMRAFVLTYHSGHIAGNDYATNDLVALARTSSGCTASASRSCRCGRSSTPAGRSHRHACPEKIAAITIDDGLDFDFVDLVHPFHGPQRSAGTCCAPSRRLMRRPLHAHVVRHRVARRAHGRSRGKKCWIINGSATTGGAQRRRPDDSTSAVTAGITSVRR